jgi:hypothetical protein
MPAAVRRTLILLAAIFAVAAGALQTSLGLGQSPADFAADSDATLKVAGWAFSIWGVIYLGLLAYAVRQALAGGDGPLARRLAWPAFVALVGIGLWIIAAALDWEVATIGLIVVSAVVLTGGLAAAGREIRGLRRYEPTRWWVVAPLSLLAGWLTIAAPVNVLTVLTGNGDLPAAISPDVWALSAVAIVSVLAVVVAWRLAFTLYALPIAWGLAGVWAAEQARNPTLALAAAGAAALILLAVSPMLLKRPKP